MRGINPTDRAALTAGRARKSGEKCGDAWGKGGDNNAQDD